MPWSVKNLVFHDKPVPLSNQRSLGYECFARSATTAVQMSAQPGMCRDELAGGARRMRGKPGMIRKPLELPPDMRAEVILGEKEHEQLGGDFEVAHILFVAVRRPHTEPEGFRHARNVAAE